MVGSGWSSGTGAFEAVLDAVDEVGVGVLVEREVKWIVMGAGPVFSGMRVTVMDTAGL